MRRSLCRLLTPLAVVVAAGCGAPRSESERIVRLVEVPPQLDAPFDVAAAPPTLELTASTLRLAEAQTVLVRSAHRPTPDGYDLRSGYFVPAGRRLRFGVRIGAGADLRFAIAAWAPAGDGTPLRFRVSSGRGDRARQLFERELVPDSEAPWQEIAIPLAGLGSGRVELELATSGGAAAWGGWAAPEISWSRPRHPRPHLVLISLDTLRADHLGAHGYARRPTSPELDAFAARALLFREAIAPAPWTRPSHRSMLSGRYPEFLGANTEFLASRLWAAGYRTLAITGGGQMDKRSGFAQGFETYLAHKWIRRPESVFEHLDARPGRQQFLFLHTYEIHDPYEHHLFTQGMPRGRLPEVFFNRSKGIVHGDWTAEERAYVEALYDGDLAFTDGKLGELFRGLERAGRLADSIVVVTSDHGEEFWEHGRWRHGHSLYDELLHVPLIVWLPPALRERFAPAYPAAAGPAVIAGQVGLIDLVPTITELLGLPEPENVQGRSLLPLLRGERPRERQLVAGSIYLAKPRFRKQALRTERYKLIAFERLLKSPPRDRAPEGVELYDLEADPGERTNVAERSPRAVLQLLGELGQLLAGGSPNADQGMPLDGDEKLRQELEALGYVGN